MNEGKETEKDAEILEVMRVLETEFAEAMNLDFNTPLALTKLTQAINTLRDFAGESGTVGRGTKESAVKTILGLANLLGLLESDRYKESMPKEAKELIAKRESLRNEKKFDEADVIRKELSGKYGVVVEDTEYGTIWYKKS